MEGEEMDVDSDDDAKVKLPPSSVRQLLHQWHMKPDGSLEQRIASSEGLEFVPSDTSSISNEWL